MLMIAAALSISLDLGRLIHGAPQTPHVECNIRTVSYRFVGDPGTEFRYDGEAFRVPASGSIELIASRKATDYLVSGRTLPLDVWPTDAFGTRTVPLPRPTPATNQ
jgi:hypothetical protein